MGSGSRLSLVASGLALIKANYPEYLVRYIADWRFRLFPP